MGTRRRVRAAAALAWIVALGAPGVARGQQQPAEAAQVADAPQGAQAPQGAHAPGPESPALAALREAERDPEQGPANVAEGAARANVALPAGLEAEFAATLAMPAIPVRITPRILRSVAAFRSERRARRLLASWIRHAARYRARIESILASENLPADLVWVVAAESSFDPGDVSSAGAVGLWQLMPEAARTYGLRIDPWVDERRDPDRATRAAARFLRDLRGRFGNWELALAAYNMGYNALLRAIRKYNTNDFEALAALEAGLPYETAHYVPRILSAAIAAHNAARFELGAITPDPAVEWDDAALDRSVPIDAFAEAIGVTPDALRALNPGLAGARTPPADALRPYVVHVPRGSRARAEAAAAQLRQAPTRVYRVRYGETLDEVAARYGATVAALRALSGFAPDVRVDPGVDVLVPDRDPIATAAIERPVIAVEPFASPPAGRRRVFYRVGVGDELGAVARALGVRRDELLAWNALDDGARMQPGMWLQAYVPGTPLDARVWEEHEVDVVRRGSEEFHDRAVALDGRVRLRVTVRDGDTMARLARRYGLSVGSLARINRISRAAELRAGDTLVVYAAPDRVARAAEGEGARAAEGEGARAAEGEGARAAGADEDRGDEAAGGRSEGGRGRQ